jgi:hypothetical protein
MIGAGLGLAAVGVVWAQTAAGTGDPNVLGGGDGAERG